MQVDSFGKVCRNASNRVHGNQVDHARAIRCPVVCIMTQSDFIRGVENYVNFDVASDGPGKKCHNKTWDNSTDKHDYFSLEGYGATSVPFDEWV